MMDRCIERFEEAIDLLLVLQPFVRCNVGEIKDLTLLFIEYQVHPLHNDSFPFVSGFVSIFRLNKLRLHSIRFYLVHLFSSWILLEHDVLK